MLASLSSLGPGLAQALPAVSVSALHALRGLGSSAAAAFSSAAQPQPEPEAHSEREARLERQHRRGFDFATAPRPQSPDEIPDVVGSVSTRACAVVATACTEARHLRETLTTLAEGVSSALTAAVTTPSPPLTATTRPVSPAGALHRVLQRGRWPRRALPGVCAGLRPALRVLQQPRHLAHGTR